MEIRLQTIDSFSGVYETEIREVEEFTGESIRDSLNRELIEMKVPVAGLFTLVSWHLTANKATAAITLRSFCPSNHYLVGIAYSKILKTKK